MAMRNPPHPGEFIASVYVEPNGISDRELAAKLDVAASTLSRVLNGTARVAPDVSFRLSMQDNHDLGIARQHANLQKIGKLKLAAV